MLNKMMITIALCCGISGLSACAQTDIPAAVQSKNNTPAGSVWIFPSPPMQNFSGLNEDIMEDRTANLMTPEIEAAFEAQDYTSVRAKLERAAAIGDPSANLLIGFTYYPPQDIPAEELGVKRDAKKALPYYRVAAEAKYPMALETIGDIYFDEDSGFYDLDKARTTYMAAITANPRDTVAIERIGKVFAKANAEPSCRNDIAEAYSGTIRGVGSQVGVWGTFSGLDSTYFASRLLHGQCVKQDIALAHHILLSRVQRGDPSALTLYASMLQEGFTVDKSKTEALKLYERAAINGYAPAFVPAAELLNAGVDKNLSKTDADARAFELYLSAAEAGNPYAMEKVRQAYANGQGIKVSEAFAKKWEGYLANRLTSERYESISEYLLLPEEEILALAEEALASPSLEDNKEAIHAIQASYSSNGGSFAIEELRKQLAVNSDNTEREKLAYWKLRNSSGSEDDELYQIVKAASEAGDAEAADHLASHHMRRERKKPGQYDWVADFEYAISLGSTEAMIGLARALSVDKHFSAPEGYVDVARANELFDQATAAGDLDAAYARATLYIPRGEAELYSDAQKVAYLKQAADAGHSKARLTYALWMLKGTNGVPVQYEAGIEMLKEEALREWNAQTLYDVANLTKDTREAQEFLNLAKKTAMTGGYSDSQLLRKIRKLESSLKETD